MVAIEEIDDTTPSPPASQERLWDAEDIETIISQLTRPTAKLQLESLVKKIRKDAKALQAIEKNSANDDSSATPTTEADPTHAPASTRAPVAAPKPIPASAPVKSPLMMYHSIDRFSFDAGSGSDKFVTLYIPLSGVGSIANKKEQITCEFGKDSFDVTVLDLDGKNYRLKRDNLEHDIDSSKSKRIVKADKIVVKLHKIKGDYGSFDFWSKLTDQKRKEKKKKSADPSAGIMDMMKDMYESGDDNMRKIIGETMSKQRNGEMNNEKPGGLGDMGDLGL